MHGEHDVASTSPVRPATFQERDSGLRSRQGRHSAVKWGSSTRSGAFAIATFQRIGAAKGFLTYVAAALAVECVLAFYFLFKSKAFAFFAFGSDTLYQYYPLQVAAARQLKALHDVTWSFDLGLGAYPGMIFDPLWLITGWMPDSWQLSLRLPVFLLRLLTAGAFFFGYLRRIGFLAPVAVIGGLGYAFSSYGTINAQWDSAPGVEFLQLAIYLYLFERYFRGKERWVAVAAGAVVGLGSPIGLYQFALFSALYASIRIAFEARASRGEVIATCAAFAGWCIPGLALATPVLLPELYYFFDSPRISGDYSLLPTLLRSLVSFNDQKALVSEIAGLVGKDLLGTGLGYAGWQNYFEGPGFYVGLLPLLSVPQLLGPCAARRERALAAIALFGIALYFCCPALRYAVYGFGHMGFRFSTLWVSVLLLVLGLVGLRRALVSGWWRAGIVLGGSAILVAMLSVAVLMHVAMNVEHFMRVTAFTLLYASLCFMASTLGDRSGRIAWLLVPVCACELLIFALPPLIERDAVNADGSSPVGRYSDGTLDALALVRDHDRDNAFYRIEKTYSSVFLNDALVQDYAGTASYYFHAASLSRFVDRMGLPRVVPNPNYISPMAARPRVLDLLAVRYVLTHDRKLDSTPSMVYVGSAGGVDVYRNEAAREFGSFYTSIESEAHADALPPQQRDAFLLKTAIVDDPDAVNATLAAMRIEYDAPVLQESVRMLRLRDDQLYGEIQTPTASLFLLPMPFDRGWSAWLDGRQVALFRADYGLTAALVPAGRHNIALSYVAPGRKLGNAAMAGGLAFLGVFALFPWLTMRLRELRSGDRHRYRGAEP
jgi:Bacterial membrane protein YfhO